MSADEAILVTPDQVPWTDSPVIPNAKGHSWPAIHPRLRLLSSASSCRHTAGIHHIGIHSRRLRPC
jgi:hypothetical protein